MSTNDLSSFIEDVTGESYLRVQENLGDGFVRLRAKEAQRRQAKQDITCFEDVVLELLRNSRDAEAHAIFIATWKEQGRRYLTVLDDGSGIPEHLHATVFEPFVTSKLDTFHEDRWGVHGRGMALYSIKENVDEAHVLFSEPGGGTALGLHALTANLSERIDQSTLPYIHLSDQGEQIMRGPRNIARIVMEFALDAKDELVIFLGSPVEIASTLVDYSEQTTKNSDGSPVQDLYDRETVLDYLNYIYDPDLFSERAAEIGLPLSARSARRILDGQIEPLAPLLERLTFEGAREQQPASTNTQEGSAEEKQRAIYGEQRRLKIAPEDQEAFRKSIEEAFNELATRYYLERSDDIKIRSGSDKLTVTIPFRMEH